MFFVKFFVSIWAQQLLEFFFNTKLWVFLIPQTNSQFLPQLSYICYTLIGCQLLSHGPITFFSTNHSQPYEWVVAKIVHFFCGSRFFAKLVGYLIEPNKITCPWGFFFFLLSYKIWTTHLTLHFHICKLFSILFKILNDNLILFLFSLVLL